MNNYENVNSKKVAIVTSSNPDINMIRNYLIGFSGYSFSIISNENVINYILNYEIEKIDNYYKLPTYEDSAEYLPGLEKVISEYDIVIIHNRSAVYSYQILKMKWKYRFKLIVDNSENYPQNISFNKQEKVIHEEVTKSADAFIIRTKAQQRSLIMDGIPSEKIIQIIPYVVKRIDKNAKLRNKLCNKLGFYRKVFIIGYIGPVDHTEDLKSLFYAIKENQKNKGKFATKILISGIGNKVSELKKIAIELNIDRDTMFLNESKDSRNLLITVSDCLFYSENNFYKVSQAGAVYDLIEAMVHKVPVIAARSSSIEEFIGKHRADYCHNSFFSLAKAIRKIDSCKNLFDDIIAKNHAKIENNFTYEKSKKSINQLVEFINASEYSGINDLSYENKIIEIESLIQNQQYLKAIDAIESVSSEDDIPIHYKAILQRLIGDCFTKLGDMDSGKDAYLSSISIDPYLVKSHLGLGTVYLLKNNYDVAIIHFRKAVNLSPNDEVASLGLGLSFQGIEEYSEAQKWIVRSLELKIDNPPALYSLVKISHERESFKDAEIILEKYLRIHPNDSDMSFTLSGILYKLGKYQSALDVLHKIEETGEINERVELLKKKIKNQIKKHKYSAVVV